MSVTPRVSISEGAGREKEGGTDGSPSLRAGDERVGRSSSLVSKVLVVAFWLLSIALVVGVRRGVRALDGGSGWADFAEVAVIFASGGVLGVVHRGVRSTEEALRIGAVWFTLSIVAELAGTIARHGKPWLVLLEDPSSQGFTWNATLVVAWLLAPVLALRRRKG